MSFLGLSCREWFRAFDTGGLSLILNEEEPMTKKHDKHHNHCEHNLEMCGKCDVAYCTKCSKEWGAECTRNHHSRWGTTYTIPCTTTTTDPFVYTTSDGTLTSHSSHS